MATSTRETTAIRAFWTHWRSAQAGIARSIGEGGMRDDQIEPLGRRVRAIHPDLDWEFGPGHVAEHHLALSGKGDPLLRAVAERWLAAAPKRSATWEFHASRQPHPGKDLRLDIGEHSLALADLVVTTKRDDDHETLDVVVHHRLFARLPDEALRGRIAFIGLETLLGEDALERWVGSVEIATKKPRGAVPLAKLAGEVKKLAKRATGDRWAILRGTRDDKPIFVSLNQAIKRVDHLALDTHLTITVPLADRSRPDGLTTDAEAHAQNALQDDLEAKLGARAVTIARETWNKRRILHLHVAWTPATKKIVDAWVKRARPYAPKVKAKADPRWEILGRWG